MRPPFLLAALTALASVSCYSPGDGQAPPLDQLYFPTGLALDKSQTNALGAPKYLYVASSDFDLQYRSSSLISYDLDAIREAVPRSCVESADCRNDEHCDNPKDGTSAVPSYFCVLGDAGPCSNGEQDEASRLLHPGRCQALDPRPFIRSAVGIGAFASDLLFAQSDQGKARLFLPVRGDATLHWIDLDDGRLECDQQSTDDDSCADSHRAGQDPSASNNNFRQPPEPFGIAITDDGKYVAVTNQTGGSVSLYTHDWASDAGPQLVNILGGLASAPVAIAAVPSVFNLDTDAYAPAPGFLVGYRNAAQLDLLRVRNDAVDAVAGEGQGNGADDGNGAGAYARYALAYAATAGIGPNSLGFDSRDIVIDASRRKGKCGLPSDPANVADPAAYRQCVVSAPQPDVYVANRAPSSLLVGSMTADFSYASGSNDLPTFTDTIELTLGPSRLVLGSVRVPATSKTPNTDESGAKYDLEPRVFVVCFDSTRIFVYDPKRHAVESIIDTGRGPYALASDDARGLLYVAHFTDSYWAWSAWINAFLNRTRPSSPASALLRPLGPPSEHIF